MRAPTNGSLPESLSTPLEQLLAPEQIDRNFDRLWAGIEADMKISKNANQRFHWLWPTALAASVFLTCVSTIVVMSTHRLPVNAVADTSAVDIYSTLADDATQLSRCGQARVRFADNVSLADIQILLHDARARIIDGPSRQGTFTLMFDTDTFTLLQLQNAAQVVMAEPVNC